MPCVSHQRTVVGFGKGTARRSDKPHAAAARADRPDRRCGSDSVLRRAGERREFVAAERDEHMARRFVPAPHGPRTSLTSVQRSPATATQGGRRNATNGTLVACAAATRVRRDASRIGMRGVDQRIDPLAQQIIRQSRGAAETAAANRHRLARRRNRAAGERQRHVKIVARRPAAPPACAPRSCRRESGSCHGACLPPEAITPTLPHRRAGCPLSVSAKTASRA